MVESETGEIIEYQYISPIKIGTSTCQFDTSNVLYSKLRPYLNKVVVPDREGFATSEMLAMKPDPKRARREYLACFLRSPSFVHHISGKVAGAKMPRARTVDLLNITLPLPGLDQQDTIIRTVFSVNKLISLRKQQIAKLDELVKARFIEMFGDLGINDHKWPFIKLSDACASPDDIKCGPFGTQLCKAEYVTSGVALWGIPQINSAFAKQPSDYLTPQKAKQLESFSLIPGDVVMSRKGNVGMCALFPDKYPSGIIHSDVLRIRADYCKINPIFLMYQLHNSPTVESQIEMVSSGAVMAGINVTKLKSISINKPPTELQNQFASFVQEVDKSKFKIQESLERFETLKKALMQQYFE